MYDGREPAPALTVWQLLLLFYISYFIFNDNDDLQITCVQNSSIFCLFKFAYLSRNDYFYFWPWKKLIITCVADLNLFQLVEKMDLFGLLITGLYINVFDFIFEVAVVEPVRLVGVAI